MAARPCAACGWQNPWTDSGDIGAANADHARECPANIKVDVATTSLPWVSKAAHALGATIINESPTLGAPGYTTITIRKA